MGGRIFHIHDHCLTNNSFAGRPRSGRLGWGGPQRAAKQTVKRPRPPLPRLYQADPSLLFSVSPVLRSQMMDRPIQRVIDRRHLGQKQVWSGRKFPQTKTIKIVMRNYGTSTENNKTVYKLSKLFRIEFI